MLVSSLAGMVPCAGSAKESGHHYELDARGYSASLYPWYTFQDQSLILLIYIVAAPRQLFASLSRSHCQYLTVVPVAHGCLDQRTQACHCELATVPVAKILRLTGHNAWCVFTLEINSPDFLTRTLVSIWIYTQTGRFAS